ncbi:MAG: hypothetical protein ACLRSE_05740 [Alistipes finegoldii]
MLTIFTTTAQTTDTSKDNFPSTQEALSRIGAAEARPGRQPADTAALTTSAQRKGFIRRIIDYYSRSNVDRTFEKKIDWSLAPGPNYSSDVGFGLGFLVAGLYRLDRTDSVTAPSNISIYGNITTQKFLLLRFSGDNIFQHNKRRLSYSGAFVYFPGAFYGVGHKAGKEGYAQDLTTTMGIFRISYCTSLVGRFYIGVSGGIDYTGAKYKSSGMGEYFTAIDNHEKEKPGGQIGELYDLYKDNKRYDPEKQDPFSNFIAATGDKPNAFNTNLGIFAQYDTRDVTFNASKGIFIKAEAKWYPQWLGNTRRNFGRFTLTFDFYQKLWKGAIFAYDLYADCTAGTPSWHMSRQAGRHGTHARLLRGALPRQTARRDADRTAAENLPPSRHRGLDRRRSGLGHRQIPVGQYALQFRLRLPLRIQEPHEHPSRLRLGRLRQPQPPVGPQTLLGIPLHRFGSLLRQRQSGHSLPADATNPDSIPQATPQAAPRSLRPYPHPLRQS